MRLSDIRDLVASFKIADHVYMSRMDAKRQKSIGVYNSKHQHTYQVAIGGAHLASYGTKYVSFLVHWNKSPQETENAAMKLFEALEKVREQNINNETIKFIQLLYEPQDIGCDDAGICEWVIEAAVIYAKKG